MLENYDLRQAFKNNSNDNISDEFNLKKFELDEKQKKETIVSIASSRQYIFFLTQSHKIFLAESHTLKTINESYRLPSPKGEYNFQEKNFNKIWADREGIHCIIRHNNATYYFNSEVKKAFEIDIFRDKEICAVSLDDRNTDINTTKNFLVADYDNKIYQCIIDVTARKIHAEELITLFLSEPRLEDEEEDEYNQKKIRIK